MPRFLVGLVTGVNLVSTTDTLVSNGFTTSLPGGVTATINVASSGISGVGIPDASAVVSNNDSVNITTSDGSVPATLAVSGNAVTAASLTNATDTIVTDGMTLGVAPTGTFTNTVTFTVAGGVITAIHLD